MLKEEEDRVMCDCFVFVGVCEDVIHVYVHVQGTTIRYRSYLLCVLHVMYIIFFFFTYYTLVLLCMYSVTGYHTLGFQ